MAERQRGRREIAARIVEARPSTRSRRNHDVSGRTIEHDRRTGARRCRGWRCQQLTDADRVTVRRLVVFLDRPHGHVVDRIDARERIVTPAPSAGPAGIRGRVVVRRRCPESRDPGTWRAIHRTEGIARQAARISRCCTDHARRGEADHGMSLARHRDRGDEILARCGPRRGIVVDGARLHDRRGG